MPKNAEFAEYLKRRLSDSPVPREAISHDTHSKLMKFFEDLIILENELEAMKEKKIRYHKASEVFQQMDRRRRGFLDISDYWEFFQATQEVTQEEVGYLFKRHDKEAKGRVTEADFLKDFMQVRV